MKTLKTCAAIAAMMFLAGCAHTINTTPPLNTISAEGVTKSDKVVGLYISKEQRALLVTTPGGGGDKVRYTPYADAEPAFNQMLSNLYTKVVALTSPNDKAELDSNKIAYVFMPTITTTSKSSSALTWPPTNFTVTLDCKATDAGGAALWNTKVTGSGDAVFDEFKHDFGLSARRAGKDAFNKLQKEIASAPALK
jgi:hypothetical protein